MYTLFEEAPDYSSLNSKAKIIMRELAKSIPPTRSDVKLPASRSLFVDDTSQQSKYLLLKEGHVQYKRNDRILFFYDEGDLIGLEDEFGKEHSQIYCDFAVIVDEYDIGDFSKAVATNAKLEQLWRAYLAIHINLMTSLMSALIKDDMKFSPRILNFEEGETIIEEGASDSEVYTLAEGSANVFVNKVQVGEIKSDEIFGAIAGLTGTPRSATVIASAPCLVLALPREKFIELIKHKPTTVQQLVNDMAGKIVALNEKIVGYEELGH